MIQFKHLALLLVLVMAIAGCSKEEDKLSGAELIEQYNLPGKYQVQISPKMLGDVVITTGEHDAVLSNEGDGVLRLRFSGFRKAPMSFQMSVDILMRIKEGANGMVIAENIGGDFDADPPEGESDINRDDLPDGLEVPQDALVGGLHSNGESTIEGVYKMLKNPDGTETMNFELELSPNVGLPITIAIQTIKKIE